jgi:hypothetical protein
VFRIDSAIINLLFYSKSHIVPADRGAKFLAYSNVGVEKRPGVRPPSVSKEPSYLRWAVFSSNSFQNFASDFCQ